eukprot:COSAG05_NODE_124_length_17559_cov_8.898643_1_plen_35_part_10
MEYRASVFVEYMEPEAWWFRLVVCASVRMFWLHFC